MRPKVYFAAKLSEAGLLRDIRDAWPSLEITSRWIDMAHLEDNATELDFAIFWSIDEVDVRRSDFIVVCPSERNLRGALVEVGMGIACGKTIVVVGNCLSYGTWQYHPLVKKADNLTLAINCILGHRVFS